ncbi:MAG: hypothetical protein ABIQ99_04695 [Thermoflexales bacterium]
MEFSTDRLAELAHCCEEEYARYFRDLKTESLCCYDLARAALQDRIQEAETHFYRIYAPLCAGWVVHFPGFEATQEPTPDVFVNIGFGKLFDRLGPKNFHQFETLPAILAYLKKCVITSVLQQLRKPASEELDENQAVAFSANVEYEQIWGRLRELLPAPDDQRLADLRFRQDLKPAEIARAYTQIWPTARVVSVALQRILRALRKDPELRARFGLPAGPEGGL